MKCWVFLLSFFFLTSAWANKPYAKLLIISELDLAKVTWDDLGLKNEKSFLRVLNKSWLSWFNKNLPPTIKEASLCEDECLSVHKTWSEISYQEIKSKIPPEYLNSVWIKINLLLRKSEGINFEWEGRVVLLDLNTKRTLGSYEIPKDEKEFTGPNQQALNSAIASQLYRAPLRAFVRFSKVLQESKGLNKVSTLKIQGYRHLGDIVEFMKMLETRGASLGLEVNFDNFTKKEVTLTCFYRGEEKSFTDVLSGINELKLSQRYTVESEFTGVHHVLKLKTK